MTQEPKESCPICGLSDQPVRRKDFEELLNVDCARCGRFRCTQDLSLPDPSAAPRLSAWIRDAHERGSGSPVDLDAEVLAEITTNLPHYRVAEKQLLLMRAIERKTRFPGELVNLYSERDFPLAWALGADEFRFLLSSLVGRQLLRSTSGDAPSVHPVQISSSGWDYLDEHRRDSPVS